MTNRLLTALFLLTATLLLGFSWLFALPAGAAPAATTILYVDDSATGANDGTSWTDAYIYLQDAIYFAETYVVPTDTAEIWVAAGIYYPDDDITGNNNNDPVVYFHMAEEVAIYGGFAATETLRSQRDWRANLTILSGDIDQNDTTDASGIITTTAAITGTNAAHVTVGSLRSATAVLDGFTITGGRATLPFNFPCKEACGGGMYISDGSPTLANLTFIGNEALVNGGGIFNYRSNPTLTNVTIEGNFANQGGGFFNDFSSSPVLTNTVFSGNVATTTAGAFYNNNSVPTLINTTMAGNYAPEAGGVYVAGASSVTIRHGLIDLNSSSAGSGQPAQIVITGTSTVDITYSLIGGGVYTGTGNVSGAPRFLTEPSSGDGSWLTLGDNSYGDLRLRLGSAAIDSGTNTNCPAADRRNLFRPIDGDSDATATCDLGAFEYAGAKSTIAKGTTTEAISWFDLLNDSSYRYVIWRSTTPYFSPGIQGSAVFTETSGSGGLFNAEPSGGGYGNAATNYCYVLVSEAIAGSQALDYSNETCEFTFSLTPGS